MPTHSYAEKLRDPRWQKLRLLVMQRDGFGCVSCHDKEKSLNVHHCFYEKGDPWLTSPNFLLTLCEPCHKKRQATENAIKRNLGVLFGRLGQEELESLSESLVKALNDEMLEYPAILPLHEIEWLSDVRWYHAAFENKTLRKSYESVVGRKVRWPGVKKK